MVASPEAKKPPASVVASQKVESDEQDLDRMLNDIEGQIDHEKDYQNSENDGDVTRVVEKFV